MRKKSNPTHQQDSSFEEKINLNNELEIINEASENHSDDFDDRDKMEETLMVKDEKDESFNFTSEEDKTDSFIKEEPEPPAEATLKPSKSVNPLFRVNWVFLLIFFLFVFDFFLYYQILKLEDELMTLKKIMQRSNETEFSSYHYFWYYIYLFLNLKFY